MFHILANFCGVNNLTMDDLQLSRQCQLTHEIPESVTLSSQELPWTGSSSPLWKSLLAHYLQKSRTPSEGQRCLLITLALCLAIRKGQCGHQNIAEDWHWKVQSKPENRDDSCSPGCLTSLPGPSARKASFLYARRRAHNDTRKLDCQ